MKNVTRALCIVLVAGITHGLPQYGQSSPHTSRNPSSARAPATPIGQNLPDGCRIEYQDIQTIIDVETEEEVCSPYTDRVCNIKYRQACNPYEDTECRTVFKKVCKVKHNEVCNDLSRDVPELYVEDDCKDELTRVCDSTWVIKNNGDKVWEEDPETCRQIPKTKCRPVQKTRTKKESYTVCNQVPYNDCKNVPVKQCSKVTRIKCERQAYNDCQDVTRQNCEVVHKKVPQSQTERKAVRVCDNDNNVDPFLGVGQSDVPAVIISSKSEPRIGGKDIETNNDNVDDAFVFSS